MEEKKENFFMKEALKEANKALKKDEVPIGAILVKDDKIIARGHNIKETKKNPMGHAEIIAIQKCAKKINSWRMSDITMYVTLEPCMMCASVMQQARIGKVVIATKDEKTGAFGSVLDINSIKSNHKIEVVEGVMQEESRKMLKEFFKRLRDEKKRKKENNRLK